MDVGTPSTIERFTLKTKGGIGGPKQQLGQHLLKRLAARTEVPGLYAVGDSTTMGEGVVSVTASAVGAANMVLGDLGHPVYTSKSTAPNVVRQVQGSPRTAPHPGTPLDPGLAARTAVECDWCEAPTCAPRCPAGIDIPGFIRRIEAGNVIGAARALREMNPPVGGLRPVLPVRAPLRIPVPPIDLRRRVRADQIPARVGDPRPPDRGLDTATAPLTGRRVAIVGAGPAGLTCAHFLARAGHESVIIDSRERAGGMLAGMVPDERLPAGVLDRELAGMSSDRITLRMGTALGTDVSLADLSQDFDAVFLAAGTVVRADLEFPGARGDQVVDAFDFLGWVYAGTSCAEGPKCRGHRRWVCGRDAALAAVRGGRAVWTLACVESAVCHAGHAHGGP